MISYSIRKPRVYQINLATKLDLNLVAINRNKADEEPKKPKARRVVKEDGFSLEECLEKIKSLIQV